MNDLAHVTKGIILMMGDVKPRLKIVQRSKSVFEIVQNNVFVCEFVWDVKYLNVQFYGTNQTRYEMADPDKFDPEKICADIKAAMLVSPALNPPNYQIGVDLAKEVVPVFCEIDGQIIANALDSMSTDARKTRRREIAKKCGRNPNRHMGIIRRHR